MGDLKLSVMSDLAFGDCFVTSSNPGVTHSVRSSFRGLLCNFVATILGKPGVPISSDLALGDCFVTSLQPSSVTQVYPFRQI